VKNPVDSLYGIAYFIELNQNLIMALPLYEHFGGYNTFGKTSRRCLVAWFGSADIIGGIAVLCQSGNSGFLER
jgi:hypothetical protein